MTKEEAIKAIKEHCYFASAVPDAKEALDMAVKALELEPCSICIDFKRYAKQMGFIIEKESIPYLMHKEMDIPLSECQKAYDVAIDYLRKQGKVKG